jgi:hypothetical protein
MAIGSHEYIVLKCCHAHARTANYSLNRYDGVWHEHCHLTFNDVWKLFTQTQRMAKGRKYISG